MVFGVRLAVWFGLSCAAVLLFLWCLLSLIEAEGVPLGYAWGVAVFGVIAAVLGLIAWFGFVNAGGRVFARRDLAATSRPAVPRGAAGRGLAGSGVRPVGDGSLPRPVAGRKLT